MRPTSANGPGTYDCSAGNVQTACGMHAPFSPAPHAVFPSGVDTMRAAAITMRYVGMGCGRLYSVRVYPPATATRVCCTPYATTASDVGATTVHVTLALSLG